MSGKEARLWRAQQKIISQQVKMEQGYRKTGQAAGESGRRAAAGNNQATQAANRAVRSLVGVAAGYMGVSRAIGFIVGSARDAQAEVKEIAAGLAETYEGAKRLWQLSDSRERYEELGAKHKLAMAKEGIAKAPAQQLAFTALSLGEEEALPQIARTARYTDPEAMADYLGRVRSTTAWGKDVGTPEQSFAALAKGAEKSGHNIEQTSEWVAYTAAGFSSMGATLEEVLGVGAAVSPSYVSVSRQATAMRKLQATLTAWREKAIDARRIMPEDAQGLIGTFEAFREKDPKQYKEQVLGEIRFAEIARAFEKPGTLKRAKELEAEIGKELQTGAAYYQKIGDRPPELTRQQDREVAQFQKELALEPLADKQRELETVLDQIKAVAAYADKPITVEVMWEKAMETGATMGMVEAATEASRQRLVDSIQTGFPETFKKYLVPELPALYESGRKPYRSSFGGIGGGFSTIGPSDKELERNRLSRDVPREITRTQREALADATFAISRKKIVERAGVDPGIFPAAQGPQTSPAAGDGAASAFGLSFLPPYQMAAPHEDTAAEAGAFRFFDTPADKTQKVPPGFDPAAKVNAVPAGAYQPDVTPAAAVDKTPGGSRLDEDLQDVAESLRKPTPAPAITAEQIASPPQLPAPPAPHAATAAPAWGSGADSESRELGAAAADLKEAATTLDRAGQRAQSRGIGLGGPDRDR
jgi:hypothetical protein